MKRCMAAGLAMLVAVTVQAAGWKDHSDQDVGVKIELPSDWKVETSSEEGSKLWTGVSPDETMMMMLTVFEGEGMDAKEIFDEFAKEMDLDVDKTSLEKSDDMVCGLATGDVEGTELVTILISAQEGSKRYILMLGSETDSFEKNSATLEAIAARIGDATAVEKVKPAEKKSGIFKNRKKASE